MLTCFNRELLWFIQTSLTSSQLREFNRIMGLYKFQTFATILPQLNLESEKQNMLLNYINLNCCNNCLSCIYSSGDCSEKTFAMQNSNIVCKHELEILMGKALPQSAPLAVKCMGNPNLLTKPKVAIIGSRHPTFYGREQCFRFAKALSSAGIAVLSGGAIGIDAIANSTAFIEGFSIAVLGSGVNIPYPRSNWNLFKQMQNSKNGLIISEFADNSLPQKWNFPRRNYLIAMLADFIFVVEANITSGSLITANAGLEFGVDIGALPGPVNNINSSGTNELISNGSFCISHPQELIDRVLSCKDMIMFRSKTSSSYFMQQAECATT